MSKKSATRKLVRKSAAEIPAASRADLNRLRAAMNMNIDTGEIPERRKVQRLHRDANGKLPTRKSAGRRKRKMQGTAC
jgi:hypothetical protein